jgi:PAS domain S-box-containing protein
MSQVVGSHLFPGGRPDTAADLRRALAHLAAVVESSDDAIISKTLDGRILSWNPAAQRLFGYSADEAVGQSIGLIIPPDRLDEERHILETLRGGGHIEQLETKRLTKDGRLVDVSITVSPVRDAAGAVIGGAKIARDITARQRAEKKLRDGERALRQANDALRVHTEELARFNHAAIGRELRIIELKREINEVLAESGREARYPLEPDGEPPAPAVPSVERHDCTVPLEAILRTHELDDRPTRPPDYEIETRALTALVRALAESPRTILQTLADTVLEVLRAGSSGLSLLTDTGEQFYWAAIAGAWRPHLGGGTPRDFGPCGDVLDCNAPMLFTHWEQRYPYLTTATPLAEEGLLVPFRVGGQTVGTIWAISHDPQHRFDREDLRLLESLGRFASVAYQAVELLGAVDQRRAALSLLEDAVHARQLAEESNRKLQASEEALRETDRRKNEFLALLGHELRNPLTPIGTSSELLAQLVGDDARARLAIDVIKRQLAQLTRLVDDLLDVARITQGRIQLRTEPLDIANVVQQAVEAVEPQLRAKQHKVFVTTSGLQPLYVEGDPVRLVQCVVNVLLNAAKYTDMGGEVRVQTHADGSTAVIEISDSGMGIDPDLLPQVFDLFVQNEQSLDRAQGGLGIGLAVVKRLVEMHGGEVNAHSPGVGAGATFQIRLPRIACPEHERAEVSAPRAPPRRVLIVDDNVDAATTIAMLLNFQGHQAEAVYNGQDALERVASFKPDVALLDIGLPEMDGYELAMRLRAMPELGDVRLVALTGYGQAEDRQRAAAAGFDDHLVKPVNLAALERALAAIPAGSSESVAADCSS